MYFTLAVVLLASMHFCLCKKVLCILFKSQNPSSPIIKILEPFCKNYSHCINDVYHCRCLLHLTVCAHHKNTQIVQTKFCEVLRQRGSIENNLLYQKNKLVYTMISSPCCFIRRGSECSYDISSRIISSRF